jgi:hypothetical protein
VQDRCCFTIGWKHLLIDNWKLVDC